MRLVPQAVPAARQAAAAPGRARARAPWLVLACYLAGAFAVTWRLWADPASRVQGAGDISQFTWFMRYSADAVAHGHLPALVTAAMNAPHGVNLMWNTAFLLPGVVFAPVTLLAGPQVSLTLVLALGFAGSAAAMFWVLRRWGASVAAAAAGGAVYGFSPALVRAGSGGYQLQFVVLLPLIIDALLRIVTGRGSAVRTGVWLGLLVAAQLFIAEEMLIYTALAGAVMVGVLAASRPREVPRRLRGAAAGLGAAAVVAAVLCGYALWVQFRGAVMAAGGFWTEVAAFVTPGSALLFHTASSAGVITGTPAQGAALMYLGWPLLAGVIAAMVVCWRRLAIRLCAVTFAVCEVLALGSHVLLPGGLRYAGPFLPWYWLQGLPVLKAALPYRLCILAAGAAGAVLAFTADAVRARAPRAAGWRSAGRLIPAGVLVAVLVALLPLIPRPYQAVSAAPLPAGWRAVFAGLRLPPEARVLVVPVPDAEIQQPLRWQAETGEPSSLIGGDFIGFSPDGHAMRAGQAGQTPTSRYLNALWQGTPAAPAPATAQIRADLTAWQPAAVVAVTSPASRLGRFLTGLFGPPARVAGGVLGWRLPG